MGEFEHLAHQLGRLSSSGLRIALSLSLAIGWWLSIAGLELDSRVRALGASDSAASASAAEGEAQTSPTRAVSQIRFNSRPAGLASRPLAFAWLPTFSPDGELLAVGLGHHGRGAGEVCVWDVESRQVQSVFYEPRGVRLVNFSPDGRTIAYGNFGGEIKLRNLATGEIEQQMFEPGGTIESLELSHDGTLLATSGKERAIRLWDVATGRLLRTLEGHTELVYAVPFSGDDRLLASGSRDRTVRVWNVADGRLLRTIVHDDEIHDLRFSPNYRSLAAPCYDGLLHFWDVATGQRSEDPIQLTPTAWPQNRYPPSRISFSQQGDRFVTSEFGIKLWDAQSREMLAEVNDHPAMVAGVAFSPDGRTLASTDIEMRVWLRDAETLEVRAELTRGDDNDDDQAVLAIACSPADGTLAVAMEDRVKLIDPASGQVRHVIEGFEDFVTDVAFSADGALLATACFDKLVKLWRQNGELVATFEGHNNLVYCVSLSPDGQLLASGGFDKAIRVWDVSSQAEIATLTGHAAGVRAVEFSPDGRLLATGSVDRTVKLWSVDRAAAGVQIEEAASLTGHTGLVRAVAFSPDGETLASASEDNTVKLWSVANRTELRSFAGHRDMVWSVAFAADGRTLASGGFDNVIRIWDAATGVEHQAFSEHRDVVCSLAFASTTDALVSGSRDGTLYVWSRAPSSIPAIVTFQDEASVAAISPDDRYLVTAGLSRGDAQVWGLESGKRLRTLGGHADGINRVVFSPDGLRLATAGLDNLVRIWTVDDGQQQAEFNLAEQPMTVRFSPDGKRLATGGPSRVVKIWDTATAQTDVPVLSLPPQPLPITSLDYSPGGKLLATATGDQNRWSVPGEVTIWDATTGARVATLGPHSAEVRGVAFSPDGRRLMTFGFSTVRVWRINGFAEEQPLHVRNIINSAVFLPDSDRVVVGGEDGALAMWGVSSRRILAHLDGHGIRNATSWISRDSTGTLVASASNQGTVKLWRLATGQQPVWGQYPLKGSRGRN